MLRRFYWIGVLTWATLLGAAGPATKPAVDLSTPKAVVDTFAHALQGSDAATVLAVAIHDEQRAPFITAWADLCHQQHQLAEAVAARFGAMEAKPFESVSVRTLLETDAAKIRIDGDRATLPRSVGDLSLRKGPQGWKVDVNALVPPQSAAAATRGLLRWARATAEITQQVNAGRYASAAKVEAAWKVHLQARTPPATAPSTTAPSAR
jgi:hypothetical protein